MPALILLAVMMFPVAATARSQPANASGAFGLYPAADFRIVTGACTDCASIRQALWYFRAETIAVASSGLPVSSFAPDVDPFDDVRQWAHARAPNAAIDYPPLIWIAAPDVVSHARISTDGRQLVTSSGAQSLRTVPKIPLNRAYYDTRSLEFFQQRGVTARGTMEGDTFVVRTLWPEDFRVGAAAPPMHEMSTAATPGDALRALIREEPRGGVQSPFTAMTLWQRPGTASEWAGKPVLALMVNGAQGDDDEAHAGHFVLVTGRVQADGSIGSWLVNNYYSLDVESEKGIIAAPVPLDNYLGDLNSGQGWYRPSYLLVAVLRDERAPVLVQSALNRVYNQFYRHQLEYYHPTQNCTSISIDTLRALGWPIPARGPTSRALAWAGFPFIALKEMSIGKAKLAFDYLYNDQTRLLPAAALEEAFGSLIGLVRANPAEGDGLLAHLLSVDVTALVFVRLPQFPSSRAFGDAPAVSTWEYEARVPNDPALAQIVPVPPRPFPDALRDADLLPRVWRPSDYAVLVWGVLSIVGIPLLLWRAWRWRRRRDH